MSTLLLERLAAARHQRGESLAGSSALAIRNVLLAALTERKLSAQQGEQLLSCADDDLPALAAVANEIRKRRVGDNN